MRESNHRPYQGYPYVNPPVHDAPTVDAATAARWNNLPRKQLELPVKRVDPVVFISLPDGYEDAETRNESLIGQELLPQKPNRDPGPVVYIDMPEGTGSHVATERQQYTEPEPNTYRQDSKRDPGDEPMVYIDLPEGNGSNITNTHVDEEPEYVQEPEPSTYRQNSKRDPGDEPMVYIDLPEGNGSNVTNTRVDEEPEYVQETIFFDPFENRRIELNKDSPGSGGRVDSESEDDVSTVSGNSRRYQHQPVRRPLPPIRPNTLDLYGAGSSGASTSNPSSSTSGLPSLMSKETMLYQGNEGGFPMSPIPVSEFPEPPPSYAEIDRVSSPVVDPAPPEPVVEQPRREEPPRTQVILPRDHIAPTTPIGIPNSDRKYLNCHHCGMRVHTLVVKENGTVTHVTAFMCLLVCLLPVVAFIYCTDYLKIKNHYCPNCNKIIGYELPFTDKKIVYVN